MNNAIILVFCIFAIQNCAGQAEPEQKVNYDGYKVYRVTADTETQFQILEKLESDGVMFWDGPNHGRQSDVMLHPQQASSASAVAQIQQCGMKLQEFIQNVGQLILTENVGINEERLTWDRYYGLADIYAFLNEQAAAHPNTASVLTIGETTEGRPLRLIKISKSSDKFKPAIFIDSNIHAREWITSAVGTYLINELLNSPDPEIQSWSDDFDWYILPVFNADGFEYSHTTDRMWRKSRSINSANCKGADLNRNFDYHWLGGGSSTNPCSDTFAGNRTFSEPETTAFANFVDSIAGDLVAYISLHSYSQFIMFPYGDTNRIPDYDNLMRVARNAATALQVKYGTRFTPGNWLDILYLSTGTSMDWVRDKHNVNLTFTYELRDTGSYGFLLPAAQIRPSSEEFMDSLGSLVDEARKISKAH